MEKTSSFRLHKHNGRKFRPREQRDGDVRFSMVDDDDDLEGILNRPFVCIKQRNSYIWKDMRELSANKFTNYKEDISEKMSSLFHSFRTEINSHNITKRKIKTTAAVKADMFAFMYNEMNLYQRTEFLKKFPDFKLILANNSCKVCKNMSKNFVKCRFDDCTKMCEDCHNNWKSKTPFNKKGTFVFGDLTNSTHKCPACSKSQLYQCPICLEEKPNEEIIKSDNCTHFICKNCFCKSFDSVPVVDCPLCRAQFKHSLGKVPVENALIV